MAEQAADPAPDVRAAVVSFIAANGLAPVDAATITGHLNIIEAGIMDSVMILELVSHIEETFAVTIAPTDIVVENFDCLDSIVALVTHLRGGRR